VKSSFGAWRFDQEAAGRTCKNATVNMKISACGMYYFNAQSGCDQQGLFLCVQNRVVGVLGRSVCETSITAQSASGRAAGRSICGWRETRDQGETSFHPEEKPGREQGEEGWQVQTSRTMHLHRMLRVMYELV
jgi:hypothetical protein